MKIRKLISAISASILAISAIPMTVNAADYPDGRNGFGYSAEATVKPVLTIDIDGMGNQVVYDDVSEIAGKTVTCSLNVSGADYSYCSVGIHIFYNERLEIVPNSYGKVATKGEAIDYEDPITGKIIYYLFSSSKEDPTAPEGFKGFMLAACGDGDYGGDGTMWTFTLKIPDDAQKGDVFPIDIIYRNGGAEDLFINKACDENGYNMQAYAFTKGIFNSKNPNGFNQSENVAKVAALENIGGDMDAYIAIDDNAKDTSTLKYGDANLDGNVSVADAVAIMQFLGNKDKYDLSAEAKANADCFNTGDGITGNDALTIQKVDAGLIKLEDLPIKN